MESPKINSYPILESLALIDGTVQNLWFHQQRMDHARVELYGEKANLTPIDLSLEVAQAYESWIFHNPAPSTQAPSLAARVKVRILYGSTLGPIQFQWYHQPEYDQALIVSVLDLDYSIKWADRSCFVPVTKAVPKKSYPLFCQHGFLTDGLTSNIVIFKNGEYLTPRIPLLKGTMRAYLLTKASIIEADLQPEDIYKAGEVILINALNPLGTWTLPVLYS